MIEYRKEIEPLCPYVPGRPIEDVKREYGLKDVVKLASNENPLGCSPKAVLAVTDALKAPGLYPDGNCTLLREALAKKKNVPGDTLIFGAGADEIITMIGKVFVNPGDECITGEMSFSQYTAATVAMGGVMVYSPMKNHGFDLDDIAEKITPKTKVIWIANPNNPTGTAFTKGEQEALLKKVPENVLVVMDEAYREFVSEDFDYPHTLEDMKKHKNLMYIKTFSKAYGLASMRVGYGIAHPNIISLFEKIRNPFNVSIPGQAAALAAFGDEAFLKASVESNREAMNIFCQELDNMGLSYIPSQANFLMVDVKKDSREVFVDLMKQGYIIRPGAAFGMDPYLRVTIGTSHQIKGFVQALKRVLA